MHSVLIFGDSLCEGLSVADAHVECFPKFTLIELATNLHPFDFPYLLREDTYTTVVIIAGTNDLVDKIPLNESMEYLQQLLEFCTNYTTIVVGVTVNNTTDELFNDSCEQLPNVYYCDVLESLESKYLQSDGIHLTQAGKTFVSKELDKFIAASRAVKDKSMAKNSCP